MTTNASLKPHEFPKRILVLVSGMSPQIVTETIYALALQPEPFIPTEIRLITTLEGKRKAVEHLLTPKTGAYFTLCEEYNLPANTFTEKQIELISDADGHALNDIQTRQDNEAAANHLMRTVKTYCKAHDTALHVSLAGGRKTMGYFAGYALSLYGRPQDRLSHVLVSPGYESLPDFFYPSNRQAELINRQGEKLYSHAAHIECADIPFMHLRTLLAKFDLLADDAPFSDVVNRYNSFNQDCRFRVDKQQTIFINNEKLELEPIDKAFFLTMLLYALQRKSSILKPKNEADSVALGLDVLTMYCWLNDANSKERSMELLKKGVKSGWISQRLKPIHRFMKQIVGPERFIQLEFITRSSATRNSHNELCLPFTSDMIEWSNWEKTIGKLFQNDAMRQKLIRQASENIKN